MIWDSNSGNGPSANTKSMNCSTRPSEFALRERPQLNRLGTTDQRIGKISKTKKTGRPGQEELTGSVLVINSRLDRQDQFRGALHFIDHQQRVTSNERLRVLSRCSEVGWPVQSTKLGTSSITNREFRQRRLSDLTSPCHDDDPCVVKSRQDCEAQVSITKTWHLAGLSFVVGLPSLRGRSAEPMWSVCRTVRSQRC